MKKLISALILSLISTIALAQYTGPGGVQKPYTTTAAAAEKAADDTLAVLEGRITSQINKDTYWFEDKSGKLIVEIDCEYMPATPISPTTRVRLTGEIDRDWGRVELDVKHVEVLQP